MLRHKIIPLVSLAFLSIAAAQTEAPAVYRNASAPLESRVEDLLSRMTLEEKVAQLTSTAFRKNTGTEEGFKGPEESLKTAMKNGLGFLENTFDPRLPAISVAEVNAAQRFLREQTRLGIPVIIGSEALHGHSGRNSTVFPTPLAIASSWNPALVQKAFDIVGREARARGSHEAHTPVIDIGRDPRWGRIEETYGEDTYLTKTFAVSIISGMQGGLSGNPGLTHIIASPKHFAGYAQVAGGRNFAQTAIDPKEFADDILPPFEAAIRIAKAQGIMASHCEVDGVPAHGNHWLLTELLRDTWGFQGVVVSDYMDIKRLEEFHHVAATVPEAARLALVAGMDVDLPQGVAYRTLAEVVRKEPALIAQLDRSVRRVLRLKFMLGLFEQPDTDPQAAEALVGCAAHTAVAEQLATESITLLKNSGNLLPLNPAKVKTIAVLGPKANSTDLGVYTVANNRTVTILDGIRKRLDATATILHEPGCEIARWSMKGDEVIFNEVPLADEEASIGRAVEAAKKADVAIVCVGGTIQESMETVYKVGAKGDRADIDLVGNQNELVQRILATGKPVIVVLMGGKPYAIPEIAEKAPAILNTFYLGETNGTALAKILFGDVNPSGKLPISFPRSVGQLPIHYSLKANSFYKDYLEMPTRPLFAFGHGLSYTSFEYSDLKLSKDTFAMDESVTFTFTVKNTGRVAGAEVAQVYFRDLVASVTRPAKLLVRFEKVQLAPGESRTLTFSLDPRTDLSFTGITMKRIVEPGDFSLMVGSASDDIRQSTKFNLR